MPIRSPLSSPTRPLADAVTAWRGRALAAPPEVGQRTGNFYRDRMLYLPTGASMTSVQSKFAAGGAGTTRCHVAWVGTSIVAGYGSTPGSTDMVSVLRDLLTPTYGVIGSVGIGVNGVPAEPDESRMSHTAAWGFSGGPRLAGTGGQIQLHRRASVIGDTLTFTSDVAGTVVDIYSFGNSKNFNYSIDGGATQTFTANTLSAVQLLTVSGLANTTHTVTITVSVAGNYTFLLGIGVRRPVGLDVSNFGYYGSVANDHRPGAFFYHAYNALDAVDPDVVLMQLGANEAIHGLGSTALYNDLGAAATAHVAAGRNVVLVVDPPIESETITTWDTFRSKIYDVADALSLPLIDLTEAWGSRAQGAALGYYADQWHPTDAGSAAAANTVHAALTTVVA